MNFKPTKSVMKTLTLEEFGPEQRTMLSDLHQETRTKLEENGVKELLPVQQVTHKLFLEGGEIVVK
jgi:superfamily II DNA/RNA helicase